MDMEFKARFAAALEDGMRALTAEAGALSAEDRADEAHHKKAACNIYGIFAKLVNAARDDAEFEQFFDKIPESWHAARLLAEGHGDFARVAMEDVKLAALDDIKRLYHAVKGGACHA